MPFAAHFAARLAAMKSPTKRRRPPEAADDPGPDRPRTRSRTRAVVPSEATATTTIHSNVEPHSEPEPGRARPGRAWPIVRQRLRDAHGLLRALLFVQSEDERVCLKLRGFVQFSQRVLSWMFLRLMRTELEGSLAEALEDLQRYTPASWNDPLDQEVLQMLLATVLAHILRGDIVELRPLVDKLTGEQVRRMERLLGVEYTNELLRGGRLQDLDGFRPWFSLRMRRPTQPIGRVMAQLDVFPHIQEWVVDERDHVSRQNAFATREARRAEMSSLNVRKWRLPKERRERMASDVWSSVDEEHYEREMDEIKQRHSVLREEEKLVLTRTRKYRLFPTRSQQQKLRQFMGTCRWTYNQAVANYRAIGESKLAKLKHLYVTHNSSRTRVYPDGMEPPPEWVFDTPDTMRTNVLRTFETSVKSAKSNLEAGNIKSFTMRFSSKKQSPGFTFSENGRSATIQHKQSAFYLSVSKLKNIRVKMVSPVDISSEIDILYLNGRWYVAIPGCVEPDPYEQRGACIALDPGTKAFVTGVDLDGNVVEVARNNKFRLKAVLKRISAAQSAIAAFKNRQGKSKRWQYRAYVRAKRTFLSCTAKLKNLVKDLHYKMCAYLVKHYDVILLPIFKTKTMLKKSSARNHGFNSSMLSLKHYQFRQLLRAKCEVKGKSVVVCSEMYTSQTCGRCYRLHIKLGSSDVFTCPHCLFSAGRDENAALNILRFVCAGSLQVFE